MLAQGSTEHEERTLFSFQAITRLPHPASSATPCTGSTTSLYPPDDHVDPVRLRRRAHVAYRIGGSVASSALGVPRSTLHVDVVCELAARHVGPFARALAGAYYVDEDTVRDAVRTQSSFNPGREPQRPGAGCSTVPVAGAMQGQAGAGTARGRSFRWEDRTPISTPLTASRLVGASETPRAAKRALDGFAAVVYDGARCQPFIAERS